MPYYRAWRLKYAMHDIDDTVLHTDPNTLNILCIAASTAQCSLVLKTSAGILSWHSAQTNQHSEQLLPAVSALLARAGLSQPDLIAVDIGPGAFTSVRVACGVAQGLALGWGCIVLPVQSLTALAHQASAVTINPKHKTIACIIDARMNECYVARYAVQEVGHGVGHDVCLIQSDAPTLLAYAQVMDLGVDCLIGNAAAVLTQWASLAATVIDAVPSAQGVLEAALAAIHSGETPVLPEFLQPLYVRNQVALTTAERTAVRLAERNANPSAIE
jgi:tRNA threonylcarbamoyladenosine biosynthesis protein TsaB